MEKLKHESMLPLFIMWLTALSQAGLVLYVPALPAIAKDLGTNPAAVKMTLTIFLLGSGFSQLFYGPLSDRYGRKIVLMIGIFLFSMGCLISLFSSGIGIFMFCRLLQGLGLGSVFTIGRAIISDCFSGVQLASVASYLSMGFAIGLGVSPLIGSYLETYFGWRADFVFLFACGITFIFLVHFVLPETAEIQEKKSVFRTFVYRTAGMYGKIIVNINFLKFLFGGLFAYGIVISYNLMTPFLVQIVLGYSIRDYGFLALLIALPYYIAASSNRNMVVKHGSHFVVQLGISLILIGGISMLICAYLAKINLAIIMLPLMIATFGQALVFPNAIAGALQSVPDVPKGKTSAMLSSLQMLLSSVLASIMAILPESNQVSLSIVLISLGLLCAITFLGNKSRMSDK